MAPDAGTGPEPQRGRARWWSVAALAGLLLADLVVPAAMAWQAALVVPTHHVDGAFQTVSGLLRLSEGQLPGRDFFPYLGIGPLFMLFPVFAALGGDLDDSVVASHFMTLLALQFVVAVLAVLIFRRRSIWTVAWAAAATVVVLYLAGDWPAFAALTQATTPGNSLRPLRAVAPYLLTALVLAVPLGTGRSRVRVAALGAACGLVMALWSNDYGLLSGGLMLVLLTGQLLRRPRDGGRRERLGDVAVLGAAAAAGWLVLGLAATGGHFRSYLAYNVADVRADQFWYFGGWDESSKIYSLGDLVAAMDAEDALLPLLVLAAVLLGALLLRDRGLLLAGYLGTTTLAAGVLASVGGHTGGYFSSLRLWALVVVLVGTARLAALAAVAVARRTALAPAVGTAVRGVVVAGLLLGLLAASLSSVRTARDADSTFAANAAFVHRPDLGGYLPVQFAEHLAVVGSGPAPVEEYMGLAGALRGPTLDLPVDAVIHALGGQRDVFAERMAARPERVVSSAPGNSSYEPWGLSANWWFYRELFRSYEPQRTSPKTLVWTRTDPAVWQPVDCRVDGYGVALAADRPGLYEVTVDYRGPGRHARAVTSLQNGINVVEGANGFVPLDPGATSQSVPVAVPDPGTGTTALALRDMPSGSGRRLTTPESCSAVRVAVPPTARTAEIYRDLLPAPLLP